MKIAQSYIKAAGSSLAVHGVLLGLVFVLPAVPLSPIAAPVPIEVEFAATATESKAAYLQEVSSPTVALRPLEQSIALAKEFPQKPAPLAFAHKQTGEQSPAVAVASDEVQAVAAAGSQAAVGDKTGEQIEKPVIRIPARYLAGSYPAYPHKALKAGQEGVVVLQVLVDVDGSAAAVTVRQSSGYVLLDEAATQSVRNWSFVPACRCETPVESYFDVRVKFSLAEAQTVI